MSVAWRNWAIEIAVAKLESQQGIAKRTIDKVNEDGN